MSVKYKEIIHDKPQTKSTLTSPSSFYASMNSTALKEIIACPDSNPQTASLVVAYIKRFMTANPLLAGEALRGIVSLTQSDERTKQMIKNDAFPVIINLIDKNMKKDSHSIRLALRALSSLLQTDKAKIRFLKQGGIDILKKLMTHFVETDVSILEQVYLLIKQLARTDPVRNELIEHTMIESLLTTFDFYFGKESDAITSIVSLLSIFAETYKGRLHIDRVGGIQVLVNTTNFYMLLSPKIVQQCCLSLRQMISNGIEVLVEVVRHYFADDASTTLTALTTLILAVDKCPTRLIHLDIIPLLVNVLETHQSNHSICQIIFGIIFLLSNDDNCRVSLQDKRSIKTLFDTFSRHFANFLPFARVGTGLLATECRRELVSEGIVTRLFEYLSVHTSSSDVPLNITTILLIVGEEPLSHSDFAKANAIPTLFSFISPTPSDHSLPSDGVSPSTPKKQQPQPVPLLENVVGIIAHLVGTTNTNQQLLQHSSQFADILSSAVENDHPSLAGRCCLVISTIALTTPIESSLVPAPSLPHSPPGDAKKDDETDSWDDLSGDEEEVAAVTDTPVALKTTEPVAATPLVALAEKTLPLLITVAQSATDPDVLSLCATAICNFSLHPAICALPCAKEATIAMIDISRFAIISASTRFGLTSDQSDFITLSPSQSLASLRRSSAAPSAALRTTINQAFFAPSTQQDTKPLENTRRRAWDALINLTASPRLLDTFTTNGGIDLVVQELTRSIEHSSDRTMNFLGLAANIIRIPTNITAFIVFEGVPPLINLLSSMFDKKNDELGLACLSVIDTLVHASSEAAKEAATLKGLELTTKILQAKWTDPKCQTLTLHALQVIECQLEFDPSGGTLSPHRTVPIAHHILQSCADTPTDPKALPAAAILLQASLKSALQHSVNSEDVLKTVVAALTATCRLRKAELSTPASEEILQTPHSKDQLSSQLSFLVRLENVLCSLLWNTTANTDSLHTLATLGTIQLLTEILGMETDPSILKLCFGVLSVLSVDPATHPQFIAAGTVAVACKTAQLDVSEKRPDSVLYFLSMLWNVSGTQTSYDTFADSNCIPTLLSVLDVPPFVSDFRLMQCLFGCLSCLALHDQTHSPILERGAARFLVPLKQHTPSLPLPPQPKNPQPFAVVVNGCCFLSNLASTDKHRERLGKAGAGKFVKKVLEMGVTVKDDSLAEKAVRCLVNLCSFAPNTSKKCVSDLTTDLLNAMTAFPQNSELFRAILDLFCILMVERGHQQDIADGPGLDTFLALVADPQQPPIVTLRAVTILCRICQDLKQTRVVLTKKGAIKIYEESLSRAEKKSTLSSILNKSLNMFAPNRKVLMETSGTAQTPPPKPKTPAKQSQKAVVTPPLKRK
ncbi:hypothetical protein BLNAU_15621 [Blattamonas nauphoetae]|uniref:Uncharacterized protein n=1 Tax=Blattamonas nauphoetae TaxID=2049346 RepID=A0ABQ9XDX6_9EUKA|nr:hypothetical protein BLNAU_15621 [Blattamonas nauphoetae]